MRSVLLSTTSTRHYSFPKHFFRIISAVCWAILQKFLKGESDAYEWLICIMQRVHFHVRVGVFNCQQILAKISFVIFDIVIKKQIECGLACYWWNSTDLGLIDMVLINLNAEIVACILSFRKSRHKQLPQAKSGKYFQIWFFPRFGAEKWRRSEHAHASYPGLFFRPPGFSPYMGREERRVQGLD